MKYLHAKTKRKYSLFILATVFPFLLLFGISTSAQIPTTISGTYTIPASMTQTCATTCTVPAFCTLRVENGATGIFNGDIIVQGNGALIVDNAIVKVAPGKRIRLMGFVYTSGPLPLPFNGGRLITNNNAKITTSVANQFWAGIEVPRGSIIGSMQGSASINNSILEYADNALTNYNTASTVAASAGGRIFAINSKFINNRLTSARLYSALNTQVVYPLDPNESGVNLDLRFSGCTFSYTSDFPYSPTQMVYVENSKAVPFWNCTFTGKDFTSAATTIGINAVNSGIRVERAPGTGTGCTFSSLRSAIIVTNGLQVDRRPFVRNSAFYNCRYDVNLSGCLNPLVVGNRFGVPASPTYFGLFLNNCTGYRVEGNVVGGNGDGAGIVAKNSGAAYNEIYRNRVQTVFAGIQPIGINKNAFSTTGLKVLCNGLVGDIAGYDVSIMRDPAMTVDNGVANAQYVTGGTPLSSGNRYFNTNFAAAYPYHNYYIENGTNILFQFDYRRFQPTASETPVYRNFTNLTYADNNSCPEHTVGGPAAPFPLHWFVSNLNSIEGNIKAIETNTARTAIDTANLDYWLGQHALLIDSISMHYQDMGYTDSLALVYSQVTKGHQYQLYLAATYVSLNRYGDAVNLLQNIPSYYELTNQEKEQIINLKAMYSVMKTLHDLGDDWALLPSADKDIVEALASTDAMFAGATARSLLVQYEGALFEPEFIIPTAAVSNQMDLVQNNKVYPNPTTDKWLLNWKEGTAQMRITDITGRLIWQKTIQNGITPIAITQLKAGVYTLQILQEERSVYQQKLVKQ